MGERKRAMYKRKRLAVEFVGAELVELTSLSLKNDNILKSLAAAAALYPAPRPLARRPLSAHSGE